MASELSLLMTGDELLSGSTLNTHSQFLAKQLKHCQLETKFHLTSCDDAEVMLMGISWLTSMKQSVVITGGLGPTVDDMTREVIAEFCEVPLVKNIDVATQVNQRLTKLGYDALCPANKQFMFPASAILFPNQQGSAWGFAIQYASAQWLYALPGPPKELQAMWHDSVRKHVVANHVAVLHHRLFWLVSHCSEQKLMDMLQAVLDKFSIQIHTCVHDNHTCDVYVNLPCLLWLVCDAKQVINNINEILNCSSILYSEHHQLIEEGLC